MIYQVLLQLFCKKFEANNAALNVFKTSCQRARLITAFKQGSLNKIIRISISDMIAWADM